VNGGTVVVNSEGDGLDSNGNAAITGGTVVVNGPEQAGNGALDANGTLDVRSGGVASGESTGGLTTGGELGSATAVGTGTAGEAATGGMGGAGGHRPR
jgi:hypothetical protein